MAEPSRDSRPTDGARDAAKAETDANAVLRRQNECLAALHEITIGLIDRLDKEELLESILERAAGLTGTEHGYIYLLEPGFEKMQMQVGMGFFKSQLGRRVRMGEGMGGRVWATETPLIVDEYHSWPGRLSDPELDRLHSIVGIPLKDSQGVVGVIGLASVQEGNRFTDEDVRLLSRFAELSLVALEKARLYTDVRRELSERRRTEAILRESEKRYKSLLESSPDPIVVYDMQGLATYVNPAFESTFGWARDEVLGRKIDFVPQECWSATQLAIERMLEGKTIQLFETRRQTKGGGVLDVQISCTLYLDRTGTPVGNIVIFRDVSARKAAERELKKYQGHLEELVADRTDELALANRQLKLEIEERKRAETKLKNREKELQAQSHHLAEVNTALKVLLKQREADRKELEESVLSNVRKLISPYVLRLNNSRLSANQSALINILETNLNNIVSPFASRLSSKMENLTPMEIRVADLIKEGRTNKEIAELLCISKNTVIFHRYNMRKKLGIKNKKVNLRSFLMSYENSG